MPDEFSTRHLRRRLLQLAVVVAVVVVVVSAGPGLASLRKRFQHASPGWLAAGVALELLSVLSYVVIFRAVFCPRMNWRLSYQIGVSEQAANSLLPANGAGGLALGAWALSRGGMSAEHIGRRTVAFFFLTSLANVAGVIIFAALYAVGVLHNDPNPALTYSFGAAGVIATAVVLSLPLLIRAKAPPQPAAGRARRLHRAARLVRDSLGDGVRDALLLLRQRSPGVLAGSLGTMAFDLATLGVCFKAFGYSPPFGVLVLGYLIGLMGGALPIPGGIGGVDGGLIGTFALYHQPLAATAAAVLAYHALATWIPALLGTVAFIRLRRTLKREAQPAAVCMPLTDAIRPVRAAPRQAGAVT